MDEREEYKSINVPINSWIKDHSFSCSDLLDNILPQHFAK